MYVSATSTRLSRGRSTPESLAMCGQFSFVSRRSSAPPPGPARTRPRPPSGGRSRGRLPAVHVCRGASALPLLVPGVGADDHDAAVPTDDPALAADLLDARLDLHGAVSTGCY